MTRPAKSGVSDELPEEQVVLEGPVRVRMPERVYVGHARAFHWRTKRGGWSKGVLVNVELSGDPIPFPGKWGDDAVYGTSFGARWLPKLTLGEIARYVARDVMASRKRNHGPGWRPSKAWALRLKRAGARHLAGKDEE